MIRIAGSLFNPENIISQYPLNSIERNIINILSSSSEVYSYDSINQLSFEIDLRTHIVNAAIGLYRSGFKFRVFRKSFCNEEYWIRTNEGGFMLKEGVKPSEAIQDIFINGSKYGNECATAIVIIFFKAVLDIYPEELFSRMFSNIHLMNWRYLDNDLGIRLYDNVADFLPGDCLYFKNPDVDPKTPEWQGENAIDLGNGMYYGHGIGIKSAEQIIYTLNNYRIEGATESAYLLDSATRPNFKYLANIYNRYIERLQMKIMNYQPCLGYI
jgi:protein-glutamine gamma-glutamyltransferase